MIDDLTAYRYSLNIFRESDFYRMRKGSTTLNDTTTKKLFLRKVNINHDDRKLL